MPAPRNWPFASTGLKGEERYYRPLLGLEQEGLQVAADFKPFGLATASGEYRHYVLDDILAATPRFGLRPRCG